MDDCRGTSRKGEIALTGGRSESFCLLSASPTLSPFSVGICFPVFIVGNVHHHFFFLCLLLILSSFLPFLLSFLLCPRFSLLLSATVCISSRSFVVLFFAFLFVWIVEPASCSSPPLLQLMVISSFSVSSFSSLFLPFSSFL